MRVKLSDVTVIYENAIGVEYEQPLVDIMDVGTMDVGTLIDPGTGEGMDMIALVIKE